MIGAIVGDIIGSVYEHHNITVTGFPLFDPYCHFTDDTVLTVAVADAILGNGDYETKLKEYFQLYPDRGFSPAFGQWARSKISEPRWSMGNGSAMRVSPIGWAFGTMEDVLEQAKRSAEPSHNHPEGIKGAQAVASAVFLARTGNSKTVIKRYVEETFHYGLDEPLDELRRKPKKDATCPGSVPQAITAFLLSDSFEDAVRKAVSIGGDSDTIACMAGAIGHAFYKTIPADIKTRVMELLDDRLRSVVVRFCDVYGCAG
jgi:ADP-ribosylglycohydrolase